MYEVVVKASAIDREKLARTEKRLEEAESTVEDDRFEFIKKEKQFKTEIDSLKMRVSELEYEARLEARLRQALPKNLQVTQKQPAS